MKNDWFAVCKDPGHGFQCPDCSHTFQMGHACLDHHSGICPKCSIDCIHWSGEHNLTVVPKKAPDSLRRVIEFTQQNLDELEAVELWLAISDIVRAGMKASH